MTATANEEVSQVNPKKTEKAVIRSKLSKEEVPRTSKRSGRSNPSPGQPVTGADDFFRKDYLHPVGVSGKRRDCDRRWNSGLSRNVKPSHPMKGSVNARQKRQPKSNGAQSRPVRPAFGGDRAVHPQAHDQRKCRTGKNRRLGMKKCNPGKETLSSADHIKMEESREIPKVNPSQGRNHVDASDHEHFTSDKEGGDDRSGFDSDMTYFISDSDLGLSEPSKEEVSSGESHDSTDESSGESHDSTDESSGESHDRTDESDSTENSSGSSREQDHSDALYDSVESDGSSDSSDDDNDNDDESTELSDDDEDDFSEGSHSDDSFHDSDEDDDEDDSDHAYNSLSSDDSGNDEEYYGELEEESEEHIYDDPDDLYGSDHIYEDPDDILYDSV